MPSLRDRLAAALTPQYRVDERVGQGGMGAVFKAYDNSLRRWVAIKVLLPQLATEVAARRFLREARTLASLNHPHIVAVHHVGEADGLFFFVMEFVEGETLAHELQRGALDIKRAIKLGRDLLDALEAVHEQGRVHCDVKPANIFIRGNRALLADFGIATTSTSGGETATVRDFQPHTPQYATPEQAEHREVSPQTDLYAVGIVLYEAVTGRKWFDHGSTYEPKQADWTGVPKNLRQVLIRALNPDPSQRWSDAREFRRRLWRTGRPSPVFPALGLAGVAASLGVVLGIFGPRMVELQFGSEGVVLVQTDLSRGADSFRPLSDSVTRFVLERLRLNTDFRTCGADEGCEDDAGIVLLVDARQRDSSWVFQTRSADGTPTILAQDVGRVGDDWREIARGMLSDLLLELYQLDTDILDDLPRDALPRDVASLEAFIDGEGLWHDANWSEARSAYERAIGLDPSCYICSWRVTDIQRWFSEDPDPEHRRRVLDHIDAFPDRYRLLIQARFNSPVDVRLDILERAAVNANSFFSAHFEFGDELLHRGALDGKLLDVAAVELGNAADRRRSFAPTWEHVLWANLMLRDTAQALAAFRALQSLPQPTDTQTQNFRMSLAVALAFQTGTEASMLGELFANAGDLVMDDRFPAFARFMMGYGTPEAAIGLGDVMSRMGHAYPGLFGQFVGLFAKGRHDSASQALRSLPRADEKGQHLLAFATQLKATSWIADSSLFDLDDVTGPLTQFRSDAVPNEVHQSIAFIVGLLGNRVALAIDPFDVVVEDPGLRLLLQADSLAMRRDLDTALAISDSLVRAELAVAALPYDDGEVRFPIYRSMLYLLRSKWYEAKGDTLAAIEALRWHENTDVYDLPIALPMPYEAGWALGTLASWQRANLLEAIEAPDVEMCRLYRNVSDLWNGGDEDFHARALEARARWDRHECAARMTAS